MIQLESRQFSDFTSIILRQKQMDLLRGQKQSRDGHLTHYEDSTLTAT